MVTDSQNDTIHTPETSEQKFMDGYYDKKAEQPDYLSFINDLQTICAGDNGKILNYIYHDFNTSYDDPNADKPRKISFADTKDENVALMQERLYVLGATDTRLEDQNFYFERSYTISAFRAMLVVGNLINEMNGSQGNTTQLERVLKDGLDQQIVHGEEEAWRKPVYNNRGILLCRSMDADMRKRQEYINPEGKITEKEVVTVVLPRIKRMLQNMATTSQAFGPK